MNPGKGLLTLFFAASLLGTSLCSRPAFAAVSQQRGVSESFDHALARQLPVAQDSALDVATDWSGLQNDGKIEALPLWTADKLRQGFARVRDTRFLRETAMPDFSRRIAWLYPDDGCFARAELASEMLGQWGYERPMKLFAFGELLAHTPNIAGGIARWWYHTVPAVRVSGSGTGKIMVLDPSIDALEPMSFDQWVSAMGGAPGKSFRFSLCDARTYDPYDSCTAPADNAEGDVLADEEEFLELEWQRLLDLDRNPVQELGDAPPWLGLVAPEFSP